MKKKLLLAAVVLAVLLLALALLPPLLPLPSLQVGLAGDLERASGGRVRIAALHGRVFPRPALVLTGVEIAAAGGDAAAEPLFRCPRVVAALSLASLLRGRFVLAVVDLERPRLATRWGEAGELLALAALAVPSSAAGPVPSWLDPGRVLTVRVREGGWCCSALPGLRLPLELRRFSGLCRLEPAAGGSRLRGHGELLGGRLEGRFFWHRRPPPGDAPAVASLVLDGRLRLRGAVLQGLELGGPVDPGLRIDRGTGDLQLDFSGRLGEGFSLHGQARLERLTATAAGIPRVVDFTAAAAATGYLAFRDGYLNLQSARLNLPGEATVFSRGLIKYRGRLFVDLLNSVKVARLEALTASLPELGRRFGFLEGAAAGDVNLVGNLEENPVVRLRLAAERLGYRRPPAAGNSRACSPWTAAAGLLSRAIAGDWLFDAGLRVGRLDFCATSLRQVELEVKKRLNQLLVEKLAAEIDGGRLRVSLAVDDLQADPRWNGSLVLKKIDMAALLPGWPFAGPATGSLVLSGKLPAGAGRFWNRGLEGSGTLEVRQGRVKAGRAAGLVFSFAPRLGLRVQDFVGPFSRLRLPLRFSRGRCRLRRFSLRGPWYRLQGDGSWDADRRLTLRGTVDYARPGRREAAGSLPHRRPFTVTGVLPSE